MANNHNNGHRTHSVPIGHAILSEPRPEFKFMKTQVNCVSVCLYINTLTRLHIAPLCMNKRENGRLHLALQIHTVHPCPIRYMHTVEWKMREPPSPPLLIFYTHLSGIRFDFECGRYGNLFSINSSTIR